MANNETPYKERLREKIRTAMVLDRLIKGYMGEVELSATQARIGLQLLNKMLPDLKAVEHSGETNQTHSLDPQSSEQVARNVLEILNAARS